MRSNATSFHQLPLQTVAALLLAATLSVPGLVAQSSNAKQPAPAAAKTPAADAAGSGQKQDRASGYYHYALAHSYEEMATTYGRPEYATRAIEEYKLALNADPESKFLNSGLAELYFKTGRVKDAILAAQDVLKTDSKNLDAHKLLGRIYLRSLGNVQNGGPSEEVLKLAIDEYVKIIQLEPDNTEDKLLLGQLYSINHDSAKAEEQFKAAQKIDPDSEEVVLNLGRLYSEQGDTRRAILILTSLSEDDQTAKTEFALGAIYDQTKESAKAIAAYQKALDMEPENLDTERALGQALFNDGQLDRALTAYKDVSSGDPNDAQSLIRIAEIQRRQGKYDDSLATLKKAKTLVSDSLEVSFNEALVEDSLGRYDEAAQLLEKLVTQSTKPPSDYKEGEKSNLSLFLDRLANVYREEGKIDETIATYDKLVALGGDYAVHAYQSEVDAYRDAHQYDKATAVARTAVTKNPGDRSFKLMLAGQLADMGKVDEGVAMAKSMLKGAPADREVDLALAQIYTRLRKWKEATEEIDKGDALSSKPDDKIYIYFLRGSLEERQKHYDDAETQFRKILETDPNNSMTLNYLGYMLADRGVKLSDALNMIQKAVRLDPQNYAYLDSLGWAYFKLGQYPQSEENLRKASERNSSDPTVHDHLGELYEKTGRLKLAAAQWEESLNEYGRTIAADADPGDVSRVQKKLDSARVRLAKETSTAGVTTAKP
jgi:tetratricopeptide (TPR) repeat protein